MMTTEETLLNEQQKEFKIVLHKDEFDATLAYHLLKPYNIEYYIDANGNLLVEHDPDFYFDTQKYRHEEQKLKQELNKKFKLFEVAQIYNEQIPTCYLMFEYIIVYKRALDWFESGFSGEPPLGIKNKREAREIIMKAEQFEDFIMSLREQRRQDS